MTIIDDSAGSQGLTLTFGSLARAYGVKLAQEWTAPSDNTQLAAQAVQWISDYAMGLPEGGGEDFFIHDGTAKDVVGFPVCAGDLLELKGLSGTLEVGLTNSGSDGNLTQITRDGETADETWTTSQSGQGDANVYLQLDPMSAVEAASDVTVQVTYWATSG